MLSAIRYLARQGLPLRGDKEEIDSNLHQLFRLLAVANPTISSMLETKRSKFTSPEIQNELICIMAQQIQRVTVQKLQSRYFAIMIDEATDVSNSEQVVIVLRWVVDSLSVLATLVALIKDVLVVLVYNPCSLFQSLFFSVSPLAHYIVWQLALSPFHHQH